MPRVERGVAEDVRHTLIHERERGRAERRSSDEREIPIGEEDRGGWGGRHALCSNAWSDSTDRHQGENEEAHGPAYTCSNGMDKSRAPIHHTSA